MFYSVIERAHNDGTTGAVDNTNTTSVVVALYYYFVAGVTSIFPIAIIFGMFSYFETIIPNEYNYAVILFIQLPYVAVNVLCACVTITREAPIQNLRRRLYIGLLLQMIIISLIMIIFIYFTARWYFYYACVFLLSLLNFASAIATNSAYGLVMISGRACVIAHQVGAALGGLSTAIMCATPISMRVTFISYYLAMSMTVTLLYIIMTGHIHNIFKPSADILDDPDVVLFHNHRCGITANNISVAIEEAQHLRSLSNATRVLHSANLFALSFTTMNVYPDALKHITSFTSHGNIVSNLSPDIITFVVFNLAIVLGALAIIIMPELSDYVLSVAVMLKVVIVPFFYLCNIPNNNEVVISDDVYVIILIIFGMISGYLGTACILKIGQHERGIARITRSGCIAAAMMSIGSVSGMMICNYSIKLL